ncbi:MAG: hypothetical protein JNM17_05070 [Archangium sp.]|nr:hypothetical protein [Archangium sp.]
MNRLNRRNSRRGAAAVEMAITMVTLIPLIFFALFLEDFAYYRLNGQEPGIAAMWDHLTPDYMKNRPDVGGMNRLKFCDHTSAFDSYKQDFDCNGGGGMGGSDDTDDGSGDFSVTGSGGGDIGHHHATGAHQCWLGQGRQVYCNTSSVMGAPNIVVGSGMQTFFTPGGWNRGGLATCNSTLNVFNWIIPQDISSEGGWLWSKKQNTDKQQSDKGREWNEGTNGTKYSIGQAHTDGKAATDNMKSWKMSQENYSMLVDPWALSHIGTVKPLSNLALTGLGQTPGSLAMVGKDLYNPLLDRTNMYYTKYGGQAADKGKNWLSDMSDFLSDNAGKDGYGDDLDSVPVNWSPPSARPGYSGGLGSGWDKNRSGNKFPEEWGPN